MTKTLDILSTLTEQYLPQMAPAERRIAINTLQSIIDAERFKLAVEYDDSEIIECHECGSVHVVKRGKDSFGRQRYLCRNCNMSFTLNRANVFTQSKLDEATWMKFAECFVDMLPLRECAQRCNVSLKTTWFMRHRVLEVLKKYTPSFEVREGCGAQVDETFFRESFKGNHTSGDFKLPRKAHHSGNSSHVRGISNEQICILTGINDAGDIFCEIAGRGRLDTNTAYALLKNKIDEGAIITTDKLPSYVPAMRELGVACHNAYSSCEHKNLNRINNLHSQLKFFMSRFRGIATRRLDNYLTWFKWRYSFKRERLFTEVVELVVRQLSCGNYRTSWRKCRETEYPFMDYWNKINAN